jgi:hypothetical protein
MNRKYLVPIITLAVTSVLSSVASAADYPSTILEDNPVGYWRLGETDGPTVTNRGSLGAAGNGETVDTPVTFGLPGAIQGDPNTAAGFDGSSAKIEVPYSPELNPTNYTIEVWANVTPDSSGVHRSPLASRDDTPSGNTAGYIFYADPGDNWQFWNGRASPWANLGGATVAPGEWAHLVGTYDGTNKLFYVNGVLVGANRTAFVPNRARVLRIGASANENPVGQFFFNGQIDEPAIYNYALSGGRILAHYRAGAATEPELVAPAIVGDPQSGDLFKGDTARLSALVTGSLPLTYQWQWNGAAIPGGTNATLVLTNLQPANAGTYSVVVKNGGGEVTSADATLNVADIGKPVITQEPRSRTVVAGANVTLNVLASGSSTFTYQWQFNGVSIPNATNATLTVNNVQSATAGSYRVVVSNAAGSTTSAEAVLQLPAAPSISYAETVRQDAPVAYWRLNETEGDVAEDLIGSHEGTYLNEVTLSVPGIPAGQTNVAARFTAESRQKVDVPFAAELNPPVFTVEAWAKVTGGSSHRSPLTSRADSPQRGYIFYADPANTWQFWSGTGTGWDIIPGPAVENDVWAHLVGTYDGTNKSFYLNGGLVGTKEVAFAVNDESVLRIGGGASEGDGNYFFEGDVDEISIYDKVLSEDRILAHYVAGLASTTSPVSPTLRAAVQGGRVAITWSTGTLQEANDLLGPWTDVPNASSPLAVTPIGARKFYRIK